jgi:hypothetical protein
LAVCVWQLFQADSDRWIDGQWTDPTVRAVFE